jgi:hypothetical protein
MKRDWSRFAGTLGICTAAPAGVFGLLVILAERWPLEDDNYSLVEDNLYLGAYVAEPPPGTRAVLNLCEEADPYRAEIHLWEPIQDAEPAPGLKWLRKMVDVVDGQQRAGLQTYVHCRNGVSRGGLVVTAYLMSKHTWPRDEALSFLRSRRPRTQPNPAFMDRLLEWEGVLQNTTKANES